MIVVTGATGALNGATADHLLERLPASDIAVAVRDTARARRFADVGVEVRHADYADPSSLSTAFAGADQVLLVSSSDPGADAVALHTRAIDAAVAAGVGRILYTSHQGAAADSPFRPARDHAATETALAACGVPWTALRNGFYAHSLDLVMGDWRDTGVVSIPVDGAVSWTAREDSAEAAAVILASADGIDGPATVTARDALTFEEVVALASASVGREISLEVVGEEQWVAARVAEGTNEFMARFTLGIFQAAHQGGFAATDPLLAALLGREPRTVQHVLGAS
ncbi:NmrA family NAD(P)-binding protein [Rhodococcus sp. MEB064]|uniref:NmrA family NAD(P)-binding protein n=1 Tax=Rhodococcus sp. MEB064 TaxID=1587522 RepID=UPI0005ACAA0B|nr:NmrA family NAD(P)-binding protein [Rhodococcus sp. MEB064]KIQ16047.1 NmrA family transcriptional regulator [Rhodococcus sp. MEB064]